MHSFLAGSHRWRVARLLIPVGGVVTLVGYFGAWIQHPVAGLTVTGLDLAEYVKFLVPVRTGEITLWRDAQGFGLRGDPRQQRPGIQMGRLVRVVLERRQVQAGSLSQLRERDDVPRPPALGRDEGSEFEIVAVVGHYVVL